MELNASITFFLLLLVVAPYSSRGRRLVADVSGLTSEIYEIDYRGPETHSYQRPSGRYGGRPHHEGIKAHPIPKGFQGGHLGGNGKK